MQPAGARQALAPVTRKRCWKTRRDRGSVYVAVLGAAMLVTLIGVGAVLTLRVRRRGSEATMAAMRAQRLAEAAAELGLRQTHEDANWRQDNLDNGWSAPLKLAGGTLEYKFVDPADHDLSNDVDQPVRLVGRGRAPIHGSNDKALRVVSVTLQPDPAPNPSDAPQTMRLVPGTWRRVVE